MNEMNAITDRNLFIKHIEDTIEASFFNSNSTQLGYVLTQIEPINNERLNQVFK